MKNQKIIELLLLAAEIYGKDISAAAQKFWIQSLEQYETTQIEAAFADYLKTAKFMPRPADIIDRLTPDLEIKAIEAYREVDHQMIVTGSYKSIKFEDKVISAVIVSYGGWIEYCQMFRGFTDRDLKFHEKDFTNRYKLFSKRGVPEKLERLPGQFEINNGALGYDVPVQSNFVPIDGETKLIEQEKKEVVAKGRKE